MALAQRNLSSRDQFIDGLTEDDFRIRVRHAKPKSLDDAVKAALEIKAIDRSEAKRRMEERAVKSLSYSSSQFLRTASHDDKGNDRRLARSLRGQASRLPRN